jgi:acetyl-CoA acetyltransferase
VKDRNRSELPSYQRDFETPIYDEFIRDDTTAEQLAALPVQPGTTRMTAANSTPLTDGANAIVLASGERAAELGVEPSARVVSSAVYALDPVIMGLAPAWALPLAIKRASSSC